MEILHTEQDLLMPILYYHILGTYGRRWHNAIELAIDHLVSESVSVVVNSTREIQCIYIFTYCIQWDLLEDGLLCEEMDYAWQNILWGVTLNTSTSTLLWSIYNLSLWYSQLMMVSSTFYIWMGSVVFIMKVVWMRDWSAFWVHWVQIMQLITWI